MLFRRARAAPHRWHRSMKSACVNRFLLQRMCGVLDGGSRKLRLSGLHGISEQARRTLCRERYAGMCHSGTTSTSVRPRGAVGLGGSEMEIG